MTKLEELLKITKNGTTAYHIVKTLEYLGFKAYGIKQNTIEKTNQPFIANVTVNSSYKHFIVVYKAEEKYLLIADPANKIKKISYNDFYNISSGVIIKMYPNKIIINEKPKTIKNILSLINLNKKETLKIGFISIIITILSIVITFFFKILLDNINNSLNQIIIFFIIIIIIKVFLDYIRYKILIKFTNDIDKNLTNKIFKKIIKLPYRYYHNHTTGEIITKINDLNILKDIIGKIILICFINIPFSLITSIILININKDLFKITLIITLLYFLIICIYHKKIIIQIDKTLNSKANINSFMTETINGFETIKGINVENKIISEFNEKNNRYIKNQIKLDKILNKQKFFKDLIDNLSNAIILILGIYLVKQNELTLSTLIAYTSLITFFQEPVKDVIDLDFQIKKSLSSLERVLDIIEIKKKKSKTENSKGLIINNLSFSLNDIDNILNNINLEIDQGEKVLITGKSGSGKSTLLKIIKGYYNDYQGQIKKPNEKQIIYISSKESLFTGTINYNLTLKSSDNLKQIKKICFTDEIIKDNDLNYNMLLEEDGINISQGQKQRIILARSLHNFNILLIDEALNAIDINLERKILKNLFKKYKNETIIIVSHRINNLDLFDRYVKLENGKIIIDSSLPKEV